MHNEIVNFDNLDNETDTLIIKGDYLFETFNYKLTNLPTSLNKVICYCEDWHSHAQNVFLSNGFSII